MFRGALGAAVFAATPVFAQDASPAALVDQCGGVRITVALDGPPDMTAQDTQIAADILTDRLPGTRLFGQNLVASVEILGPQRLRLHRVGAEEFGLPLEELFARGEDLAAYDVIGHTTDQADLDGQAWFEMSDEPGVFAIVDPGPVIAQFGITEAYMDFDQNNRPAIFVDMTPDTAAAFCDATADRVGSIFAVTMGDKLMTAPRVQSPICGGSLMITGSFMLQEAEELAAQLNRGAFHYDVEILEETIVSPSESGVAGCAVTAAVGD